METKVRKYGLWKEEDMERAIASFQNGDMGINAICRTYGVPKKTLKRRLEGKNTYATNEKQVFGRPQDLPSELENELVQHVLDLEQMFFGVTREDLKKMAFQLAEANSIPHRFNNESKMAGDKWYYSFISRHPQLSLRKPEPTSMARATGFTKERTEAFFDLLTKVVDDNKLQATDIFNVDETALSTVQRPRKVLALKGKHQVGSMTSAERGTLTTGIFCMSAAGVFVPPMLVFKGLRFKPEWKIGAPPGTTFQMSESGWSNADVFLNWLKTFVAFIKPNKSKKCLIILDGHASHTKNLHVIDYARENGIILMSLPSHTSHRLQPLDVSFFGPLKTNFNKACEQYIRTHLTKITVSHISLLLNESYPKTAAVATAINGFKATGIWPVNKDIFNEIDFAVSPNAPDSGNSTMRSAQPSNDASLFSTIQSPISDEEPQQSSTQTPAVSFATPSVKNFKSIKEISPLPETSKMTKKKRKSTVTPVVEILTSSPYKTLLLEKEKQQSERNLKTEVKLKEKVITNSKPRKMPPAVKRIIKFETEKDHADSKISRTKTAKKPKTSSNGSSWFCQVCKEEREEDMIQCLKCSDWFHVVCVGVKPSQKMFHCSMPNCKV